MISEFIDAAGEIKTNFRKYWRSTCQISPLRMTVRPVRILKAIKSRFSAKLFSWAIGDLECMQYISSMAVIAKVSLKFKKSMNSKCAIKREN